MADIQRQELACTDCRKIFRFSLDFELDGNHEIKCPGCGHIHYRVIIDGKITEERFNQNPSYMIYNATSYYMTSGTSSATNDTSYTGTGGTSAGTGSGFLRNAWMNSTSTS